MPEDNLYAIESSSAPSSAFISKISFIFLRALSSDSSSKRVAAPSADDSNIPVTPEPNPLSMFSGMSNIPLDFLLRENSLGGKVRATLLRSLLRLRNLVISSLSS